MPRESALNESALNESALNGGNTNPTVVRVGSTVRRAMRPSSATVHRLLNFLDEQGYCCSPKFLGIDAKGREKLSFIKGSCEISPTVWRSDSMLKTAARGLKQLHDITATYPTHADDIWAYSYPDTNRHDVICHNDFGLYNLVTNNNTFTGIIDFDLAGPAPRLRDIAYAAYWLTPLSFSADDMTPFALADQKNGGRRLKQFCASYGVVADTALLDMVSEILHFMSSEESMAQLFDNDTAAKLRSNGHLRHWQHEARAFDANRENIARAL